MKHNYIIEKAFLLTGVLLFCITLVSAQTIIQSIATAEAASLTPDEVADVPADSKVRYTTGDTASYEAFVLFDIGSINAEMISSITISTSAGQHNPYGESRIDPYWVDMYGCTTVDWPDPFTWNSSRDMDKSSEALASINVQGQQSGYMFTGEGVVNWIKDRQAAGASKVTFRFHAREEHPWGIWVNGTYQDGMQMLVEYEEIVDDPASYVDTIAKINFTFPISSDEAGWVNVYGSPSFPADLGNGVSCSVSGSNLAAGSVGEPSSIFPDSVGGTYNWIEAADDDPVTFTISGLDPREIYRFDIFSSRDDESASGDRTTIFAVKNPTTSEGELLIYDDVFTYTDDLHGFKWFDVWDIEDSPDDWTTPYNYETGVSYQRYEVISQPTSQVAHMQFGYWQDNGQGGFRESLSTQTRIAGPGSVGYHNSTPSTWWELDLEDTVDFSMPDEFTHLGFPLWSDDMLLVSDWVTNNDWSKKDLYHPLEVRASVVAVPEGESFSGWHYWLNYDKEVSVNPVGNTDSLLHISAVTASTEGEVIINMSKLNDNYGYINALIITSQGLTVHAPADLREEIQCYPNPANDYLIISNLTGKNTITLFDITGIKHKEMHAVCSGDFSFSMNDLKPGIYLVRIVNQEYPSGKSIKIIKQ
jgi:Secretion system C-terminal sorting domain